jgi:hypothetical protein
VKSAEHGLLGGLDALQELARLNFEQSSPIGILPLRNVL